MRRFCVSPKVALLKVLFCRSPTTVDLHSGWVEVDVCAMHDATEIASARMQITPQDLVGMPHYLNFSVTSWCAKTVETADFSANLPTMHRHLSVPAAIFLATASCCVQAQTQKPAAQSVETRLAAQNALFEESWQTSLRLNPTRATAVGDYRYNDQLGDDSLAAIAHRHDLDVADLAKIKAIDATGFPERDLISHDLFLRQVQQRVEDYDLKEYEMPISGMGGIHTGLADLPLSMPFDSVKHYEDYISRLHQIPKAFQQTEEVLRAGVKDHLVIVRFIAEKVPGQCDGVISANPFVIPVKKFPASFSEADKKRLTDEINAAVQTEVFPAYKQFSSFISTDYIPNTRTTLSIESLPGGKRRYQAALRGFTTTDLTAAQIHAIGLKEVDRITAEMAALAKEFGTVAVAEVVPLRNSTTV